MQQIQNPNNYIRNITQHIPTYGHFLYQAGFLNILSSEQRKKTKNA